LVPIGSHHGLAGISSDSITAKAASMRTTTRCCTRTFGACSRASRGLALFLLDSAFSGEPEQSAHKNQEAPMDTASLKRKGGSLLTAGLSAWCTSMSGASASGTGASSAYAAEAVQHARNVVINDVRLSDAQVANIEREYHIRIIDATYWYDKVSGAWGLQG